MTKQDIVQQISQKTGLPITEVTTVVEGFNEALAGAFEKGESVFFRGFGTYQVVTRKAKAARNIKLGTAVNVPEHKTVKFKLSSQININK